MTIAKFGINNDPYAFLGLRYKFPNAITTLRKHYAGNQIDLTDNGIPRIQNLKKQIPDLLTKQKEVEQYSRELYSLVRPWEVLISIDKREELNSELSRFSKDSYEEAKYTTYKQDLEQVVEAIINQALQEIEKKEKERKPEKTEENADKEFPKDLGEKMDTSSKAQKERDEFATRKRLQREDLKIIPELDRLAFGTILGNADAGYNLAILTANGVGIKHRDKDVRLGSMFLIGSLAIATLKNLNTFLARDIYIAGQNIEQTRKEEIKDSISILQAIITSLQIPYYGLNDNNSTIRNKALEIEKNNINAAIKLKRILNN